MSGKRTQVVIIGAGIAGLAAAQALTEAGIENLVLESRDRYGGRIWPDNILSSPVGRGAQWIHGLDNNPLVSLAHQFSSQYYPINSRNLFDRHGHLIDPNIVKNFSHILEAALQQANTMAWQKPHDISLAEALAAIINVEKWSPAEEDLFLRKLKFFENYVGAEYELLSARHWNEEEDAAGADAAVLEDGYAAIIKGLAEASTIQLNTIVKVIRTRKHDVEILTTQGTIYADAVIVTLPLGVLKKKTVIFDPPLSISKQSAIDRLGMGLFNIVGLRFPKIFWPADSQVFFLPNATGFSFFICIRYFFNEPILVGYIGGKTGRSIENETDMNIIQQVIKQFKIFFGKNIPAPEKYFITRWGQDPFSFGSYSYLPVGATGDDRDQLAQAESNRLFFAGEASHRQFPATVHGAYLSGLREAEKIKTVLQ